MLAQETLDWLDSKDVDVCQHLGAAYPERELLRALVRGDTATGGIFSSAYRALLQIEIPELQGRASARAYAHEVMFASDFGCHAISAPQEVQALLDSAIPFHLEDTDTLGELLITAHLLSYVSPVIKAAQLVFDSDWQALPRDTFEHYHPILVGGILYALTGK